MKRTLFSELSKSVNEIGNELAVRCFKLAAFVSYQQGNSFLLVIIPGGARDVTMMACRSWVVIMVDTCDCGKKFETDFRLIKQGAEAKLYEGNYLGRLTIVKERFKKSYRHVDLDNRLTKERMKSEARALLRCKLAGIYFLFNFIASALISLCGGKCADGFIL
jgi:hypothetical protein